MFCLFPRSIDGVNAKYNHTISENNNKTFVKKFLKLCMYLNVSKNAFTTLASRISVQARISVQGGILTKNK